MSIDVNSNIISGSSFDTSGNILNNPRVVTDGLLLWLDAGNNASYINSSNYYDCGYGCQYYASDPGCTNCNTQWKDMSGFGNDGTLNGGSSITYENVGGSALFGGAGQIVTTPLASTSFGTDMTWNVWTYCHSDVSLNMFMGRWLPYFAFNGGSQFYFSNSIGGTQQTIATSSIYSLNTWYNSTYTTSYSGGNTTMSIYVNGEYSTSNSFAGAQSDGGTNFCIGDGNNTSWYRFDGQVAIVQIYNRTLTETEIRQNFNDGRQRFGV